MWMTLCGTSQGVWGRFQKGQLPRALKWAQPGGQCGVGGGRRGQEGGRQAAASSVKSPCGQERALGLPPGGRGGREASEQKPVRSALGCKASLLGRGYVVRAGGRDGGTGQLGQWRWRGDK